MQDQYFEHPILDDQQMANLKIQPGDYQFEVFDAELKQSKSGNMMIELKIRVWDNNGKIHNMFDFLVALESMAYKIKQFWESVGHPDKYKEKNLVTDYVGKCGTCKVSPQKNQMNGSMDNKITSYLKPAEGSVDKLKTLDLDSVTDDDIPF